MKKVFFLFSILFCALGVEAQKYAEFGKAELQARYHLGDTEEQIGRFTTFVGEIFPIEILGFNLGMKRRVLEDPTLLYKETAILFGLSFRTELWKGSEVKLGVNKALGASHFKAGEVFLPYSGLVRGTQIPLTFIYSQEKIRFFPKIQTKGSIFFKKIADLGGFEPEVIEIRERDYSFSLDVSLYRKPKGKDDNFYTTPQVGYSIENGKHLVKVGGVVSSDLMRLDVASLGYFYEVNTGMQGVYLSINLAGLYVPQGGCLGGKCSRF